MEKNYTIGLIVVFLIILTITLIMIFRKKDKVDKEDTTPALTSSGNLLSSTLQTPLTGNNNILVSDGTGNVSSIGFPRGTIIMWSPEPDETKPPPGWAICDGSTIRITTSQGAQVDFTLPDLRGRFPIGVNGGNISNATTGYTWQETTPISSLSAYSIRSTGGQEKVALTIPEMPNHDHVISGKWFGVSGDGSTKAYTPEGNDPTNYSQSNLDSNNTGGDPTTGNTVPHESRPPYCAVYFIIKLG